MRKTNLVPAVIALALMAAACTADEAGTTTSSGEGTTTTSTVTSTTNSMGTTTPTDRSLELVDCEDASEEVAIVCEAYDLIQTHYVDPIDDAVLAEAAAQGLEQLDGAGSDELLVCATPTDAFSSACDVAAGEADDSVEAAEAMVAGLAAYGLDPNSAYLDPQALDLLQEEQQGEIEGIGALVSPEDETIPGENKQCGLVSETCRLLIVSTISGAPAEDAGLARGDAIVGVDGEAILGWTVDEVTATVRGAAGTDVSLTIDRDDEVFEVTITRAAVIIPVIEQEIFDDVGYVRLATFSGGAAAQFETAIVDLLAQGVEDLVIDLRNNPGGFLTTAIDVTSVFLDEGDVVVTEGAEETTSYPVNGSAIVPDDVNVFFVVNRGSASASEVVSATLQESERAQIVGESTFGKNTVQQRFNLSNGGALKLTIARWLTPGGLDFGGTGVTPDVELDVNDLTAAELVAAVTGT
ncbi:MAG: S41 family peptidase [Acidimicrobiia bacterium]